MFCVSVPLRRGVTRSPPQTERLNLIMTVASTALGCSGALIGLVLDMYGPRFTMLASGVMSLAGCLLFGLKARAARRRCLPPPRACVIDRYLHTSVKI